MRKWRLFFAILCATATLSACAKTPGGAAVSDSPANSAGASLSPAPGISAPMDDAVMYEIYTDVSALPRLLIDMDDVCVFDDRTLTLEDSIDNEPELLTYNLFYYITSAQFDLLMELVGEEEHIQIAMGNEEANFEEGRYLTEQTLHSLRTLTAEDLTRVSPWEKEDILNMIETFAFEEYVIVELEESWTYNEACLAAGPQLGDGERYTRYYLFAKTPSVPEFKLYGVYWEDFLAE